MSVSSIDSGSMTSAILNAKHGEQISRIQFAVAAKIKDIAGAQDAAVVNLIESAAESMSQSVNRVNAAVGSMLDVQA